MTTAMYRIHGGDLERGGSASGELKQMLKKVGMDTAALRRTMISAYEAEMNVVIHAHHGEMRVVLGDGVLEVEVVDEGPGIPDIARAMIEGYSTAPPAARELGFGAGLGLPNIKKSSDALNIQSTVGKGTCVHFTIRFAPQVAGVHGRVSLRVVVELCRQCLRCVHACATAAVRVRDGVPHVLEHLCFDCCECIAACGPRALTMDGVDADGPRGAGEVVVVPPALLVQFGPAAGAHDGAAALAALGFGEVRVTVGWERALREAVCDYARSKPGNGPVISPVCPAVVNLIEIRFASLLGRLAPFVSPVEAAVRGLAGRDALAVAVCPAMQGVLAAPRGRPGVRVVAAPPVVSAMARRVGEGGEGDAIAAEGTPGSASAGVLRVSGVRHVVAALEALENGQLGDAEVLEPWACEHGCFGSPLLPQDGAVARWRWERTGGGFEAPGEAVRREEPFQPRRGMRLDDDMAAAIAKLGEIDRLTRRLPGRDCGLCGAPTCQALAEDVVLGRAAETACMYRTTEQEPAK